MRVRGLRPPAARGPPLRRGGGDGPAAGGDRRGSGSARRSWSGWPGCSTRRRSSGCADYRFSGDIDGYPEGELYFPGSPILTVSGTFADAVRAGDAGAVDPQPRLRGGLGRGPDGHRRRGPSADRDGVAAHPRGGRGRRRPARPTWPASPPPRTWRRAPLRHPDRRHRRARLRAAARRRAGRVPRPGQGAWARSTTLLVDTYDIRKGIEHAVAGRRARSSARSGSTPATSACWPARPATSSTGWARPAPGSCCPATSTSTRSPRCAPSPSTPTAWAPRWSPAPGRRPRHGLQAGRGRRAAGGQAQRVEGVAGRARSRRCAGTSRRARRSRRSCTAGRRRPSSARTTGWCRCR